MRDIETIHLTSIRILSRARPKIGLLERASARWSELVAQCTCVTYTIDDLLFDQRLQITLDAALAATIRESFDNLAGSQLAALLQEIHNPVLGVCKAHLNPGNWRIDLVHRAAVDRCDEGRADIAKGRRLHLLRRQDLYHSVKPLPVSLDKAGLIQDPLQARVACDLDREQIILGDAWRYSAWADPLDPVPEEGDP